MRPARPRSGRRRSGDRASRGGCPPRRCTRRGSRLAGLRAGPDSSPAAVRGTSGRGGERTRRSHRPRRAAPARTRAASRAGRSVRRRAPSAGLVEERRELVEVGSRDRLGGVEGEGAAKDRETAEGSLASESSRSWLHSIVARSVRCRSGRSTAPPVKQRQRLIEALEQGGGRDELRARRGELDREREVVQAPADRSDALVGSEPAPGGGRAADEELGRGNVRQRLDGEALARRSGVAARAT